MANPPASTKSSLQQRLTARARTRWPQITEVGVRLRAQFAYVTATLTDGGHLPLCRLRYGGSASRWGFAVYRASHDDYETSMLPSGEFTGTPEEALDCAAASTSATPPPGSPTHHGRTNRQKH
jgi:hypothetical protein